MIYGKHQFRVRGEHGNVYLTVTGHTVTIKQGNDLIRLTLEEAQELESDLGEGIGELIADRLARQVDRP